MILWLHPFLKLDQLVSWTTSKPLYPTLSALHTLLPLMPWYRRCCVVRCFWGCECENTLILMAWHCRAEVLSEWIAAGIVCQGLYDWHKHHMLVCGELEVGRGYRNPWNFRFDRVSRVRELVIYADNKRCKYASISSKKCKTVKSEKTKFPDKSLLKLNTHKHIHYLCMHKHVFHFDVIVHPPFLLRSALQSQEFP